MRRSLGTTWLAVVALGLGCSEPAPSTQLAVWVSADAALVAELAAIRVELFRHGQDRGEPAVATHTFALADVRGTAPPLSFSFGIADSGPGAFILAARGCGDSEACKRTLVEHKVRVRFESQKTLQLVLHLDAACAGEDALCLAIDETCRPHDVEPWRGRCMNVPWAETTTPSKPDLGPPSGTVSSAASVQACEMANACWGSYRCIAQAGGGAACEGQFASWSLPDALPDSRTPPSYDPLSTPGVIYDHATGLTWQRALPQKYEGCSRGDEQLGEACTWSEANDYCRQLDLAGLRWRLPTFIELATLVDYRREILTLPLETFSITTRHPYWTASPFHVAEFPEPSEFFIWQFASGRFGKAERDSAQHVRCVHSGTPAAELPLEHYTYRESEDLIVDNYTNLVWHGSVQCSRELSFAEAADYCGGLSHRLRVPSLKELLTLIDPMVERARLDPRTPYVAPMFSTHAVDGYFWSSTESKQFAGKYLLWLAYPDVQDETTLPSVRAAVDGALAALLSPDSTADASTGETVESVLCVRCVR